MCEETKYIADDGTVFDTRDEALAHENRERFQQWFKASPIRDATGFPVPVANVLGWLRKNRETVLEVLRALQK